MLTAVIRPGLSASIRGPACLRQQSVNSGRRGRTVSWSRQLLQLLLLRLGLLQDGDVGGRRLSRGRRSPGRQRVRPRNWAKSLAMVFGVPCRLTGTNPNIFQLSVVGSGLRERRFPVTTNRGEA